MSFDIATWNVNSLRVRLPNLTEWLSATPALDAMALQETKIADADFPGPELHALGWHSSGLVQMKFYCVGCFLVMCVLSFYSIDQMTVLGACFGMGLFALFQGGT